jgi:hypothetical protein
MKKIFFVILALLIMSMQPVSAENNENDDGAGPGNGMHRAGRATVLEFKTMVGVSGPFTGATNPIRGIGGGGVPWVISVGKGELKANGKLEIKVRGLIIPTTGTNPAPSFRGVVSCMIIDGTGAPGNLNVSTGDFPATPAGDANIEEVLDLPTSCFAPIIFVTNSAGRWFAVTGF